ncbi:MAG: hypothetical protein JXX28_04930 [Deltaproteobacteria bacterium]|nr:hypothetical protein [Deltaproteobacteria bacterium]
MLPARFQVHSLSLDPDLSDEAAGRALVSAVIQNLARTGGAPSVALAVHLARVDLFPLAQIGVARAELDGFLGALSRAEVDGEASVRAVGLMGSFRWEQRGRAPAEVAMVFLEWGDCRWWHWRALLTADRRGVVEGSALFTSAVEGDPKPPQLGTWWSRGRRQGLSLRLDRQPRLVTEVAGVH